jgi:hypothetical protein
VIIGLIVLIAIIAFILVIEWFIAKDRHGKLRRDSET